LARSWFVRAVAAEVRGDVPVAENGYRWVTRLDASNPWSWVYLARFFDRERRWAESELAWTKAVDLGPDLAETHAGYAAARGRAGDEDGEILHLQMSLRAGATSVVSERLFELHQRHNDQPGMRAVMEIWKGLALHDPVERLRRARAARTVGDHAGALDDLVAIDGSEQMGEVGALLVDSAFAACRLDQALVWARAKARPSPSERLIVALVAERTGDARLLATLDGLVAPESTENPTYPAPRLPVPPNEFALRTAETLLRKRDVASARVILGSPPAAGAPWASVLLARASLMAGERPDLALAPPPDHGATPAWRALAFEVGSLSAADVAAWLRTDPTRTRPFADALADALVRGPLPGALRVDLHPEPGGIGAAGDRLWLPVRDLRAYWVARAWHTVESALRKGVPAEAAPTVRTALDLVPDDPVLWWLLAQVDPDSSGRGLGRAIELDPCFAPALLDTATGAAGPDALRWAARARAADPLSGAARRALAQHGLDGP
jgi:hypothetical protein